MISTWKEFFDKERVQPYYIELKKRIDEEYKTHTIYPPYNLIYNAFEHTPYNKVKVVIIGQDPYHNPGQAMGMSFSVPDDVASPPSLVNIYKEIENEYNVIINKTGDLTYLAKQGVLLLNALLTVRENQPLSHQGIGYETLISHVMEALDENNNPMVFLLWGNSAKKMIPFIKNPNHLILTSAHPSPLSAYHGFFGNNHFVKTNDYLISKGVEPIDWVKKF